MTVAGWVGDFETHVTVAPADDAELRLWAEEHGGKYTRIVLDRGDSPDQPMLTFRGRGTLDAQRALAGERVERLRDAGFRVVRVKIEAPPFNAGVIGDGLYFEHHVKLVLADDVEVAAARETSVRHGAHLSRNARRALVDGRHERFVTQRCYDVEAAEAGRRLDALVAALSGFTVVEVEREYVVVDDHPGLDDGWLDPARTTP
jgi:hypothetical protein